MIKTYQAEKQRLLDELRAEGIQDDMVLEAINAVPRHEFVTAEMLPQAWDNIALPIARGQTISQPYVVASMTEALQLTDRDKVLEIGTGCGYQAAVLSKLARRVYTIERHKPLHEEAEQRFHALHIRNITAICADGMKGWPKINGMSQAPFNKIIVTAAARNKPPSALLDQLDIGGIMICPVDLGNGQQVLRRYKKEAEDTWSQRDVMPVRFVPLLPDVASDEVAA